MKKLLKLDSNLKYSSGSNNVAITGICDLKNVSNSKIIFVKNKKFLISLIELKERYVESVVILSEKLISDNELIEKLEKKFPNIYSSLNLEDSICIISKHFYDDFYQDMNLYVDGRQMGSVDIDPTSLISQHVFIGENVKIGKDVKIHSGVRIYPNVEISDNCEIFSNVIIYPKTVIKNKVRIHAGTTIGSDGFGYNFIEGEHKKIWHLGGVIISADVEVGSNTTIDSGTFSPTFIDVGARIDNLVQIAHNCYIGKHAVICGQVGISGSCNIGDYTVLAGKVGLSHGVTLGNQCVVAAAAVVAGNWPDNTKLGGNPARPFSEWLRSKAYLKKLINKKV